jgi:hypothetical protein
MDRGHKLKDYPGRRQALTEVLLKGRPIVYRYELDPDFPRCIPRLNMRIRVHPSGSVEIYRVG